MEEKTLYGALLLHEALLVALYVDRIRFDKELRRIISEWRTVTCDIWKGRGWVYRNVPNVGRD